jgi:hypothetical protein
MNGLDGILGMSQNNPFTLGGDPTVDLVVGPLYVTYLKQQGLIPKNEFSFYLSVSYNSLIDIGPP